MKHNYSDFADLAELVHVDSMQNLKEAGYRGPGLDTLCEELKIEKRGHPGLGDAKKLQTVCTTKSELQNPYGYTFVYIISYLDAKLPVPAQRVHYLANRCALPAELEYILNGYARPKTALNMKQVCKIAYFYFKDRSLHL